MDQTSDNTTSITEAEALNVIARGVSRENKQEVGRTLSYCTDSVKLRGFNVRKLAQKLEIKAEEKGETFNADSYMSNISNANGIMGLFEFNLELFTAWLETSETKSLSKIYSQFRACFVEPKPSKKGASNKGADDDQPEVALIDQMIANLPHLTPEERVRLIEAAFAFDNAEQPEADVAQAA